VVGEERDAPLPVVEAYRAGDDLVDLLPEATAREPVLAHEAVPLVDREGVPVVRVDAPLRHRVEADVAHPLRDLRVEARLDVRRRTLRSGGLLDNAVELRAIRLRLTGGLGRGLVEPRLGHGGV